MMEEQEGKIKKQDQKAENNLEEEKGRHFFPLTEAQRLKFTQSLLKVLLKSFSIYWYSQAVSEDSQKKMVIVSGRERELLLQHLAPLQKN